MDIFSCNIPCSQNCGLDDFFQSHTLGTTKESNATFQNFSPFPIENYIQDSLNPDFSSLSLVTFLVIIRMLQNGYNGV